MTASPCAGAAHGPDQLGMAEGAHVVQVQRVRCVVGPVDVGVGPVRGQLHIVARVAVRHPTRRARLLERERQLGRAELHVVAPLGLGVEVERDGRRQMPRRRGVCEVEDVLGRDEAVPREPAVGRAVHLVAERQRRGVPPGEVGADRRARRPCAEDRPVADVPVRRIVPAVGVVVLRQPPDVVVAHDRVVAVPDADLVVERARPVVPHPQEPAGAELRLGVEVRPAGASAHLRGKVADAHEQDGVGVGRRVDELQVVAGVPPAAGRVDPHAERREVALERAVAVDLRRAVCHGVGVVQVRRRRTKRGAHDRRPVALDAVERECVSDGSGVRATLRSRRGRWPGPAPDRRCSG